MKQLFFVFFLFCFFEIGILSAQEKECSDLPCQLYEKGNEALVFGEYQTLGEIALEIDKDYEAADLYFRKAASFIDSLSIKKVMKDF